MALVEIMSKEIPESNKEFKGIVKTLIYETKEKSGIVRQKSAVCMAKLCADEEVKKYVRSLHGLQLLMSLKSSNLI